MSYDIFCYKSKSGSPDFDEAMTAMESEEDSEQEYKSDTTNKLAIAKALMDYDPSLESFEFDHKEIAKLQKISEQETLDIYDHIELNTKEGDLAIQLTIRNESVFISAPYWYADENAVTLFARIEEYTKIIRREADYYTFNPQTGEVYDPLVQDIASAELYIGTTRMTLSKNNGGANVQTKKTWWKFW